MDQYNEFIKELDQGIRELENLKKTAEGDVKRHMGKRYATKHGSAALVKRTKLNIRDCFRRIEAIFDWNQCGHTYNRMIHDEVKRIESEGEKQ